MLTVTAEGVNARLVDAAVCTNDSTVGLVVRNVVLRLGVER